ncbi:MAG TPA: hypothetical protein VN969_15080 [Streptosporangiaceae bacterium]|nr:hypothetical protein [Streptosporangiaceae bacterium]
MRASRLPVWVRLRSPGLVPRRAARLHHGQVRREPGTGGLECIAAGLGSAGILALITGQLAGARTGGFRPSE